LLHQILEETRDLLGVLGRTAILGKKLDHEGVASCSFIHYSEAA